MEGTARLMAELMYGSGLRLMELLRLRVKDVDLTRQQVIVRGGKGDKDRVDGPAGGAHRAGAARTGIASEAYTSRTARGGSGRRVAA